MEAAEPLAMAAMHCQANIVSRSREFENPTGKQGAKQATLNEDIALGHSPF